MILSAVTAPAAIVAPARERGLKSRLKNLKSRNMRRSREGAWIEITKAVI